MARQESDRENMLREATAMVRRAEFQFPSAPEPVFAGFKRTGAFSVYFGPEPVYQFDSEGRLRRAYAGGFLFRTQGQTLAKMNRERAAEETILRREDLTAEDLETFLTAMRSRLRTFRDELSSGDWTRMKQIPPDADLVPEILSSIDTILEAKPALAPAIRGKR